VRARASSRRAARVATGVSLLILVAALGVAWKLMFRDTSKPVSVADAVSDYRSGKPRTGASSPRGRAPAPASTSSGRVAKRHCEERRPVMRSTAIPRKPQWQFSGRSAAS
jgi:hypothetical protein